MPDTPLNPDALESAARAVNAAHTYDYLTPWDVLVNSGDKANQFRVKRDREYARAAVSAYLAAALPEVTSVPGVYDLGAPEPAGVDHVVECDEFGEPDVRGDSANEPTWSKTTDGTRWKGYKDGKEYRTWADLVRRYGPLTEYLPEVKP